LVTQSLFSIAKLIPLKLSVATDTNISNAIATMFAETTQRALRAPG
jgi:hypothetical protein